LYLEEGGEMKDIELQPKISSNPDEAYMQGIRDIKTIILGAMDARLEHMKEQGVPDEVVSMLEKLFLDLVEDTEIRRVQREQ
jgi:hypothetical protein